MRLNIRSIIIDNILSIGHIEMKVEKQGIVLVEGRNMTDASLAVNGSGKSSMLGSIFYALYGHFPSKNGAKADAVINRKVGKKSKVELSFEKGGHEYKIIRTRKPNALEFYCDGANLTTNSASNTEKAIQNVVGISEELFSNAILFDSINTHRFALMNDKERKEMFTELLGLNLYARAHELAKEDLAENEQNLQGLKNGLQVKQSELSFYKQQEQTATQQLAQWENQVAISEKAFKDATDALNNLDVNTTNSKIQYFRDEIEALQMGYTTNVSSVAEYTALSTANQKVQEKEREIRTIQQEVQNLYTSRGRFKESTLCPTCGNEMDAEHRQAELSKIESRLAELTKLAETIVPLYQEEKAKLPALQEAYNKAKEAEESSRQNAQEVTGEISKLNSEITKLTMAMNQLQQNKQSAENNLNYIKGQKPSTTDLYDKIRQTEQSIATHEESILSLTDKITDLKEVVKVYSDKGVKSHLIDQAVPFLNERISEYLAVLTGSTISVKMTTQKELTTGDKSDKIDLQVDNIAGSGTYNSLSAGEKRRVDIAISLALQDLVMKKSNLQVNALFYDEVFENLDAVGCENVVELLKSRLDVADSIFVITHNESLKPLFNNVMTVVKENGFSRLETEFHEED